ncbi:LysR substrate-binding domain-containing protein [Undibacterium sp. SXout7W]|uniref:LysR family transcriptional regulator n=1 Tax=Undibacterium sp. SXout7W TaxID=3413049 RepID=UPI003BF17F8B
MKIENISDLHVLIQTAKGGSLSAAAATLNITPAAASATLKRLEKQLGSRLFERSTRALRITAQGQILLDYAQRAFELLHEGESQASANHAGLIGTLRVAAPSDLTRTVLLPWLSEFMEMHPGVQLKLSIGDRPLDVLRDEVDVALRYGQLSDSGLVARLLVNTRTFLCAAPSYLHKHGTPQTPEELAQHNCLIFERSGRPYRVWKFSKEGKTKVVSVTGDRSMDDAALAREWAIAGAGIILKSGIDIQADVQRGRLNTFLSDWETETYPLHALLPSNRFIPARVRAFVDFLANRFASGKNESL